MKRLMTLAVFLICASFAFLTYSTSAKTREAERSLTRIEREIALEQEKIDMLNAEWAILTRPERLRHLVSINFDSLELLQIGEVNYGEASSIPYLVVDDDLEIDKIDAEALDAILAEITDADGTNDEKEGL